MIQEGRQSNRTSSGEISSCNVCFSLYKMLRLRYIFHLLIMDNQIIPILGILAGILVPVAVFIWLYFDAKNQRETAVEISRNLGDAKKVEELLQIFEQRKKEPIDYRRSGVITLFVGMGLYLMGYLALGRILEAVGALVGLIGLGTLIAGYLYPNTEGEINKAVDAYEND